MITWRYECVSTTPSRGSSTLRVSRWVPVELLSSWLILVNWSGFAHDPLCVYINGTGRDYYEFYIQLNRCGTLGGNTHNALNRKHPSVSNLIYSFFGLFWFHQLHCDGNVRVKDTVEWSSHRLQMIPAGGFILLTLFYFILFFFLIGTEELHVEHAEHPVQYHDRGRMGWALQSYLRVWQRLLEDGHFSLPWRRVSSMAYHR